MDWNSTGCLASNTVATVDCVFPLFQNILTAAFGLSGVVALFFVIWSGVKLLTSGGDAKKVGSARQTLMYAIIGLVLILVSYFIISLISYITGVSCIKTFSFTNCGWDPYAGGGPH